MGPSTDAQNRHRAVDGDAQGGVATFLLLDRLIGRSVGGWFGRLVGWLVVGDGLLVVVLVVDNGKLCRHILQLSLARFCYFITLTCCLLPG